MLPSIVVDGGPGCSPVYADNFEIASIQFSNGSYWQAYYPGSTSPASVAGQTFLDGANASTFPGVATELLFPAIAAGSGLLSIYIQNYLVNTTFANIGWSGPTTFSVYARSALAGSQMTINLTDYTTPAAVTLNFTPTSTDAIYTTPPLTVALGDNLQVWLGADDYGGNGAPLSDVIVGGSWTAPVSANAGESIVNTYGPHTGALTYLPTSCPAYFPVVRHNFPSGLASSGKTLLAFGDSETSNPNGAGATSWYVQPGGVGGVTLTDWAYSGMGVQDMDYEVQQKIAADPAVCVLFASYNNLRGGQFFSGPYSEPFERYYMKHSVSQCQAVGSAIVVATAVPNYGDPYWTAYFEGAMEDFDAWVATAFPGAVVLDFHSLLGDATNSYAMRSSVDSGDHIHPNNTGTTAMGVLWGQAILYAESPPVIYPQVVTVTHSTTRQYVLTYGTGPFTWSHTNSSAGSISQGGLYTATTSGQSDTVTATDALGATSSSAVTVN
jgi:hypothetical protein